VSNQVSTKARVLRVLEPLMLVAVAVVLVVCALFNVSGSAFVTLFVVVCSLVLFFASFEEQRMPLRQIMPIVVLSALGVAGRILFAAVPDVKPVTAIVIITGMMFGKRSGFMVGALVALVSNVFFGQGPWTPWQMYTWGIIGYTAGILSRFEWMQKPVAIYGFGFVSALLFGVILNCWYVIGFVTTFSWTTIGLTFVASLAMDFTHAIATVVFLRILYWPWRSKLLRIKEKYLLGDSCNPAQNAPLNMPVDVSK